MTRPVPKETVPKGTVLKDTVLKKTVLIGFADALAAIESAYSLADHGFEVCAFARAGTRPALARSKLVRVAPITPPEQDYSQAVADLGALIRDLGPAAVLPLDDHAVWLTDQVDRHASMGPSAAAVIAGPTGKLAELALDKRQQLELARTAGFAVPESADAATGQPPGDGPWIVKPALAVQLASGTLRRPSGRIAHTLAEVRDIAARIGGPAIAQPLIDGTGEGVFGLATAAGPAAVSAHQRVRMMNPRGSGSSACRSIPLAPDLAGPVREFISGADWRGLFMVEMLRDRAGRPWFMELNGRTWGSMALARRRGLDYPAWAVAAALDPEFEPPYPALTEIPAPHLTVRHLGREIVHLGMVLARGGAPRPGTVRDVLAWRRGERWYNWRPGEPAVFAADAWATLSSQLGGKLRGRKR
jgi:biotin carboxylase